MGIKEQSYNRELIRTGKLTEKMIDSLLEIGIRKFQEEQKLIVDGLAGRKTQDKLLSLLSNNVQPESTEWVYRIPTGKGVYIRTLRNLGTPNQLVKKAKEVGLSFVVVGSIWQDKLAGVERNKIFNSNKELIEYSQAFRDAGIDVWVWGYPYPGREGMFVQTILEHAAITKAVGIFLDPEAPYRRKQNNASLLVELLEPALKDEGLGVVVTSYGSVWYFKDFPYKEFAKLKNGSPQVYDKDNNLPITHGMKAYNAYKTAGFDKVIMSAPGFNKTKTSLKTLLHSYPPESQAVVFWDWANLKLLENNPLWEIIKEYNLGE